MSAFVSIGADAETVPSGSCVGGRVEMQPTGDPSVALSVNYHGQEYLRRLAALCSRLADELDAYDKQAAADLAEARQIVRDLHAERGPCDCDYCRTPA